MKINFKPRPFWLFTFFSITLFLYGCAHPVQGQRGQPLMLTDTRSIGERIKSNIAFKVPPEWQRNDPAEYSVALSPDGSIQKISLLSSSGLPEFDAAVRRAIESAQPFSLMGIAGSPPRFVLKSHPIEPR
jgi:colicin import membrane protein